MSRRRATRDDPLTPTQRRFNMSRIRGADTEPELIIRRGLHALGLRFRLHDRKLPGTPDLVFASARAIVLVHGCFWHGHDCVLGVRPRTNAAFWDTKVRRNQRRDQEVNEALVSAGWRIATVWECALRGRNRQPMEHVLSTLVEFVRGDCHRLSIGISGKPEASLDAAPDPTNRKSLLL